MTSYYLGIDVSKGYADFVILDSHKQPVKDSFQLDDTFRPLSALPATEPVSGRATGGGYPCRGGKYRGI